jgi:hypothetical protein
MWSAVSIKKKWKLYSIVRTVMLLCVEVSALMPTIQRLTIEVMQDAYVYVHSLGNCSSKSDLH